MRVGPESHLGSHGKMVDTFTFLKENKAAGEKSFERVVRANPGRWLKTLATGADRLR